MMSTAARVFGAVAAGVLPHGAPATAAAQRLIADAEALGALARATLTLSPCSLADCATAVVVFAKSAASAAAPSGLVDAAAVGAADGLRFALVVEAATIVARGGVEPAVAAAAAAHVIEGALAPLWAAAVPLERDLAAVVDLVVAAAGAAGASECPRLGMWVVGALGAAAAGGGGGGGAAASSTRVRAAARAGAAWAAMCDDDALAALAGAAAGALACESEVVRVCVARSLLPAIVAAASGRPQSPALERLRAAVRAMLASPRGAVFLDGVAVLCQFFEALVAPSELASDNGLPWRVAHAAMGSPDPLTRRRGVFLLESGLAALSSGVAEGVGYVLSRRLDREDATVFAEAAAAAAAPVTVSAAPAAAASWRVQWDIYVQLYEALDAYPVHLVSPVWPRIALLLQSARSAPLAPVPADKLPPVPAPAVGRDVPLEWTSVLLGMAFRNTAAQIRSLAVHSATTDVPEDWRAPGARVHVGMMLPPAYVATGLVAACDDSELYKGLEEGMAPRMLKYFVAYANSLDVAQRCVAVAQLRAAAGCVHQFESCVRAQRALPAPLPTFHGRRRFQDRAQVPAAGVPARVRAARRARRVQQGHESVAPGAVDRRRRGGRAGGACARARRLQHCRLHEPPDCAGRALCSVTKDHCLFVRVRVRLTCFPKDNCLFVRACVRLTCLLVRGRSWRRRATRTRMRTSTRPSRRAC